MIKSLKYFVRKKTFNKTKQKIYEKFDKKKITPEEK